MAFGEKNRVTYSQEHRAQAKADKLPLITIDVDKGELPREAGLGTARFTIQGCSCNAHMRRFAEMLLSMLDTLHPELLAEQERLYPGEPRYVVQKPKKQMVKRAVKKS
jgi:hypothetical protein